MFSGVVAFSVWPFGRCWWTLRGLDLLHTPYDCVGLVILGTLEWSTQVLALIRYERAEGGRSRSGFCRIGFVCDSAPQTRVFLYHKLARCYRRGRSRNNNHRDTGFPFGGKFCSLCRPGSRLRFNGDGIRDLGLSRCRSRFFDGGVQGFMTLCLPTPR